MSEEEGMLHLFSGYCVCVLPGFIFSELFTILSLQEGVGWEIFTITWGNHQGPNFGYFLRGG